MGEDSEVDADGDPRGEAEEKEAMNEETQVKEFKTRLCMKTNLLLLLGVVFALLIIGLFVMLIRSAKTSDHTPAELPTVPEKPIAAQVSVDLAAPSTANNELYIDITWDAPDLTNMSSFRIEIQASDLSWHTDLTGCDGSNQLIATSESCSTAIATLKS